LEAVEIVTIEFIELISIPVLSTIIYYGKFADKQVEESDFKEPIMNILITGGSGFLGKNIYEHLSMNHKVLAPSHQDLDLTDEQVLRSFFKRNSVDVVIHGAWKPGHRNAKDMTDLIYTNIRLFLNLVRNKDYYHRFINLGSGSIYDARNYLPKMKENYFGAHIPVDNGGFVKYNCAQYIETLDGFVDLRLFGVFGKYEDYAIRFISNAICKALFDLPITMKQNKNFDYLFIDDLMPVMDYFIQNDSKYKAYNVTPNQSIDLYSLAEKVIRIAQKDLPIFVGKSGMGLEYSGDNSRLKDEVPNLSFTPIDVAIEKLYSWYSNYKELIDRDLLLIDP
jgi:UDP-glucose 4-epimerase